MDAGLGVLPEVRSRRVRSLVSAVLVLLCGCTSSGVGVARIQDSADAQATWLTNVPVEQVATCLGRAYGTAPQQSGQDWSVNDTTSATVYRIAPLSDPLNRYSTRIDQIGQTASERPIRVSDCVVAVE
ncbi:hypothetical protein KZ810_16230 [Sphingomonas sp. RHCKR47]|nr:hypothetical protein [Sphingomonas citricola]